MQIQVIGTAPTMTSIELVNFINDQRGMAGPLLRHDNFMAKVPEVLGEEGVLNFKDTYKHPQNGQTYPCYRFPKREACLMAMSYSYELQAKVFDRMTALEQAASAPTLPDFSNPAIAARAWADQFEQATTAKQALLEAKPAVEFHAVVAAAKGACFVEEFAKTIGWGRNNFFRQLRDDDILYESGHNHNLPMQQYINAGYFIVKTTVDNNRLDMFGNPTVNKTTLITGKGEIWLTKKYFGVEPTNKTKARVKAALKLVAA